MPWSGGENPVPGQRVEVRLRNGRQYEDYLSEGWAADKTGPEDYWKHGNDPYLQQLEIIAFRLAPTAPVEASGSEDLARKLTAIRDKFLMPTPDKDFTDYAIITRCIEALRPQRGETREIVEEWAAMPPRLLAHLRRWRRIDEKKGLAIVIHHGGEQIGSVRTGFAACAKAAGLSGVTPHWLRHTAATWLMEQNVDGWEAAGYLGMTTATLESHYGHHRPDHQSAARRAMR